MYPRSIFQHVSAIIGILSNFLLIFLIVSKSPKTLGSYKILMIYISIFEILYSILDALIVPKMFSQNSGALIFVFAEDALLPDKFLFTANIIYCTFFGISMAVFAIHFIYRYLAVTGNYLVQNHNRKLIFSLLLFPVIFGIFWFNLTYFTLGPFYEADNFVRKYYLIDHDLQLSDIHYVGYYFYPEDVHGNKTINWKSFIGVVFQGTFIYISFGLIFYFGFKCHRHTKSLTMNIVHSSSHNSLQTQLFYALVFQTIIPVFLMHIPSTISLLAAIINVSIESVSQTLAFTISLYPALDPLPNFFIIKTYRFAIFGFFKKLIRGILCQKQVSSNVITVHNKNELFMSKTSKIIVI